MADSSDDESEVLGLLGLHGVLIVPAPGRVSDDLSGQESSEGRGEWLIGLARWSDSANGYVAGAEGPMFETREEALAEAQRVLDWLATQPQDTDLTRVWTTLQRLGSDEANDLPRTSAAWGGMRT